MKYLKTFENMNTKFKIGDNVIISKNIMDNDYFDYDFTNFLVNKQGVIVEINTNLSGNWYLVRIDISSLDENTFYDIRDRYDEDTDYLYVDYGEDVFEFSERDLEKI